MYKPVFSKQFGTTKNNTLIVDNIGSTFRQNYGNGIPISTYFGNDKDDDLLKLIKLLQRLIDVYATDGSIRFVDKRTYLD
jgi:TFIIF-interacting CTD phosphatase-like protein